MAEAAEPELGRTGQHDWLRRLAREHDNIRTALRCAIGMGDAGSALRTAGAIWRFWLLHGDLSEGRGWLRTSLDLDPSASPRARAKAMWGLAWLAYHQGDYAVAETCADELVRAAEPDGDPVETRNALTIRGIVDLAYGRFAEAIPPLERCVELLRDSGPSWLLATSLLNLGQATTYAGDTRAESILEESRQVYLELGDQHFAARSTLYLGYAALLRQHCRRRRRAAGDDQHAAVPGGPCSARALPGAAQVFGRRRSVAVELGAGPSHDVRRGGR